MDQYELPLASNSTRTGRVSFSGHETFPLRSAWLKKAVDEVEQDPNIFRSDDAIAVFGVGRNMVRSIRFWGLATGVLQDHQDERYAVEVTPLGKFLFGSEGRDPFMEDPATLWLLHWQLCKDSSETSLWQYIFGYWRGGALEFEKLHSGLEQWVAERGGVLPSIPTLKRDYRCFVNTYVPPRTKGSSPEDWVACPLAELGLIQQRGGLLYFQQRHRIDVDPDIFSFAVLEYWRRVARQRASLAVDEVLHRPGSPGQIFMLSDEQALRILDEVGSRPRSPFEYQDSEGVRQLVRSQQAIDECRILNSRYRMSTVGELVLEVTA